MKQYYLPAQDAERLSWLQNFSAKLGLYASKYGITTAEVTDMTTAAQYLSYWLNMRNQVEENLHRIVAFKDELMNGISNGTVPSIMPAVPTWATAPALSPAGIFVRARTIVSKIKAQKSLYTDRCGWQGFGHSRGGHCDRFDYG